MSNFCSWPTEKSNSCRLSIIKPPSYVCWNGCRDGRKPGWAWSPSRSRSSRSRQLPLTLMCCRQTCQTTSLSLSSLIWKFLHLNPSLSGLGSPVRIDSGPQQWQLRGWLPTDCQEFPFLSVIATAYFPRRASAAWPCELGCTSQFWMESQEELDWRKGEGGEEDKPQWWWVRRGWKIPAYVF